MRKNRIVFFLFGLLGLILASCSTNQHPGFEETENGVYYKVHYRGNDTTSIRSSDWVTVDMDYRLKDTILFSSKTMTEDFVFPLIKPMFEGDLYDGLKLMHEGDSMSFAIVADSFFLVTTKSRKLPDFVQPGDPMYFDVKLLKRYSDMQYKALLDEKNAEKKQFESINLKAYLDKNNITTKALPSGLIFIPINEGQGKKPDTGDMCRIYLRVEVLDGELLYSNFEGESIDVEYGKEFDTEGFMEGLGMLKVGGKARLIVPSSIGVGDNGKVTVPGFTTLIYEVELVEIRSVEEVQNERAEKKKAREAEIARLKEIEPDRIQKYITKNNILQQPSASGLYVVELISGNGTKPDIGDVVKLHYALFSVEGKKLDSSYDRDEPIEVTIDPSQVFKAWAEGIPHISVGGKSRLIVPSSLAYGSVPQGEITPYSPLIFDIELLEIVKR